jgi:hypothetical protein
MKIFAIFVIQNQPKVGFPKICGGVKQWRKTARTFAGFAENDRFYTAVFYRVCLSLNCSSATQ